MTIPPIQPITADTTPSVCEKCGRAFNSMGYAERFCIFCRGPKGSK